MANKASYSGTTHIYVLIDPRNGEVRYVGKTVDIDDRLRRHLQILENTHKSHWIRQLLKLGLTPQMEVVETVLGSGATQERQWIAKLKASGTSFEFRYPLPL